MTAADPHAPSPALEPAGVYVHFPFCLKKCPYCDFVSYARDRAAIDHEGYADAVVAELDRRAGALAGRELSTIFFGGGTPSLWEPRALGRVVAAILRAAPRRAADVEITVECNPTSLDEDRARALVDQGVGRVSIGLQGLDAGRLGFLGRLHDPAGGLAALAAAIRAGVPRVSGDLIYGVAGGGAAEQRPTEAAEEARRVVETGVGHVSAYSLTIEAGTQFGELARRGRLPLATEDAVAETFYAVDEALGAAGFGHYEVSNYARPGEEARHNLGYWRGRDYVGLGCAAVGAVAGYAEAAGRPGFAARWRNWTDPARYVAAALGGEPLGEPGELLDPATRLRERIMLGVRLRDGLDLAEAARPLGLDPWTPARRKAAARLAAAGRLVVEGDRVRVTPAGWMFADGTAAALFD
jgi:oxygen-independent coproporphyrinogen-3 oxidase